MQMSKKLKAARGFTLIELMIVVAIIGILAAIAIPNFLRYQMRTKRSEGSVNVAAIRTGQIAYFAANDSFMHQATFYPSTDPGPGKQTWVQTSTEARAFHELGFQPEGEVYFSYRTQAAGDNSTPHTFTVEAIGDIDGDDVNSCWAFGRPNVAADGTQTDPPALDTSCTRGITASGDGESSGGDDDNTEDGVDSHYNKVTLVTPERVY